MVTTVQQQIDVSRRPEAERVFNGPSSPRSAAALSSAFPREAGRGPPTPSPTPLQGHRNWPPKNSRSGGQSPVLWVFRPQF